MTPYIEKITNKICAETKKAAAASHYFAPRQEATQIVKQIIADTKRACAENVYASGMSNAIYEALIMDAEVGGAE